MGYSFVAKRTVFHQVQTLTEEAVVEEKQRAISPPTAGPIKPRVMKPQGEQGGEMNRASFILVRETRKKRFQIAL